jgi:hypothetical protein
VTTVFLRVIDTEDKGRTLKSLIGGLGRDASECRFDVDPQTFKLVPQSPFAYWASARLRGLFTSLRPTGRSLLVTSGTGTLDDFRFVRAWWEESRNSSGSDPPFWNPYAKGGSYSPFYFDHYLVVNWASNGAEMKAWIVSRYGGGHWARNIRSTEHYFRPGFTWPRRTQGGLSFRAMPAGCIFADKGPAAFDQDDRGGTLLAYLAAVNSKIFRTLVDLQMAFGSYEVGVIQRTPIPDFHPADESSLAALAHRTWSHKRLLDSQAEFSHAFTLPRLLQVAGHTIAIRASEWVQHVHEIDADLTTIQAEIDERCFELYRINDEDRAAIVHGVGSGDAGGSEPTEILGEDEGGEEDEDGADAENGPDAVGLAAELVSWAVGVAVGRFDVRLATGERPLPSEPEPFDTLPVCSPGMLSGDDGLPVARAPAGYPLSFPKEGILIDDPGHPRDLTAAVRAVFEVVFVSRADAMWQEAAALLDPRDHDLRRWLAAEFFEHHLRGYSKSRRKAPILWQLGIPSGRYSIWCYAHQMTRDSLLTIQNEIVGPKFATEERRLSSLVTQAGEPPSAHERAEIATQESFVDELRTLAEEVSRVAPLWNPDLDDGIVLVLAPLWRLVPTYKAWQKELRSKWDELVAGKYDWAHVAMHLWPERVVPKCATDRSLAIAHGLEDVFWVEGTDGKWSARKKSTRPIAELVAEHTSRAVKAALAALLEAQQPLGAGKRRGRTSQEAS